MPSNRQNKVLPISIDVKQHEKYASPLSQSETLDAVRAVSDRGVKWQGAPNEAPLDPKERAALEAALIQNIEDFDQTQFLYLLDSFGKAQALFPALNKHLRTGVLYVLSKHLPNFSKDEFLNLIDFLIALRFSFCAMPPDLQIIFAKKLAFEISNMVPTDLSKILSALSKIGLKWRSLEVVSGVQKVDLREPIVDRLTCQTLNSEPDSIWKTLFALKRLKFEKAAGPAKMDHICTLFFEALIPECVGEQTKKAWFVFKALKFGKKDIEASLHELLKNAAADGPSRSSTAEKPSRPTKRAPKKRALHESPDPYHDYSLY